MGSVTNPTGTYYRPMDYITKAEREQLDPLHLTDYYPREYVIKAQQIGEYREPKEGEWYISGSIIEAYKANVDMSSKRWIAELVLLRKIERWEEVYNGR